MHNLAMAVAAKEGYHVTGSDDEIFDPAKSHLEAAGLLPKEMGWHPERITKDLDAVVLGMHARQDNPELARARELLAGTDRKSAQIALDVGYNDAHYFSYLFKKNLGLTPGEYRAQNQNEPK